MTKAGQIGAKIGPNWAKFGSSWAKLPKSLFQFKKISFFSKIHAESMKNKARVAKMDFWAKYPCEMTKIEPNRAKNHMSSNSKRNFVHRQKLDFTMISRLKILIFHGNFDKKLPF